MTASLSLPILKASGLIIGLSLFGKFLGLWRELETARLFGVSVSFDAFVAAWTLFFFVGRMSSDSFLVSIPGLLASYSRNREDLDDVWGNLFRSVILISVAMMVISGLLLPLLVPILFGGLEESVQHLVVQLVRWLLPVVAGWTITGMLGAVLNMQHRYGGYQMALLITNVGVLAVLWLFADQVGIVALAWGWSVGIWLGVGVLVWLLRVELKHIRLWEGWQSQWQMMRALMGGASGLAVWFALTQMPVWLDRYFAAQLAPGSLSALAWAQQLFQLPLTLVTVIVMNIWVVRVAEMSIDQVVPQTFRLMGRLMLVTFPAAAVLGLLARPIVTLVYARGAFDIQSVAVTSGPFAMYALGLGFHTLSAVQVRTFQARGLARYPVLTAGIDILLTGALITWMISQGWGATGIAATNTIVAATRVLVLTAFLYAISKRHTA